MYNAMDVEGVEKLIDLMMSFQAEHESPKVTMKKISKRMPDYKMSNELVTHESASFSASH